MLKLTSAGSRSGSWVGGLYFCFLNRESLRRLESTSLAGGFLRRLPGLLLVPKSPLLSVSFPGASLFHVHLLVSM